MATIRMAAIQARKRMISGKIARPAKVVAAVNKSIDALIDLVQQAAGQGCKAVCLPEDCLGTEIWQCCQPQLAPGVIKQCSDLALRRFSGAARSCGLYLVFCCDFVANGQFANTAVLIGPRGQEIGRYEKVHLPLFEQWKRRGTSFPVFQTEDLGTVGLAICFDLVFPETARSLALAGAGVVFHPSLGGAAFGDENDIGKAAMRTRAVDNGLYIISTMRGEHSIIVGPQGQVLAWGGKKPDAILMADIDPFGGRELGDSYAGTYPDVRARLFRERVPAAYGRLVEGSPAFVSQLPPLPDIKQLCETARLAIAEGDAAFRRAELMIKKGQVDDARLLLRELRDRFPTTWIHEAARRKLDELE